jgi:hypothetical protein
MIKKIIILSIAMGANLQAANLAEESFQVHSAFSNKTIPIFLDNQDSTHLLQQLQQRQRIERSTECLSLFVCTFATAVLTFTGTVLCIVFSS